MTYDNDDPITINISVIFSAVLARLCKFYVVANRCVQGRHQLRFQKSYQFQIPKTNPRPDPCNCLCVGARSAEAPLTRLTPACCVVIVTLTGPLGARAQLVLAVSIAVPSSFEEDMLHTKAFGLRSGQCSLNDLAI